MGESPFIRWPEGAMGGGSVLGRICLFWGRKGATSHVGGIIGGGLRDFVANLVITLHKAGHTVEHAEHILGHQYLPIALGRRGP